MPVPLASEMRVVAFLAALLAGESAVAQLGGSPILGSLAAGVLLGPALADAVPHSAAFALLGALGMMLLVVESGISVDVTGVRATGGRALGAAAIGVVGPVALAVGVVVMR